MLSVNEVERLKELKIIVPDKLMKLRHKISSDSVETCKGIKSILEKYVTDLDEILREFGIDSVETCKGINSISEKYAAELDELLREFGIDPMKKD